MKKKENIIKIEGYEINISDKKLHDIKIFMDELFRKNGKALSKLAHE